MITILPDETRIEYLIRVAVHALREHAFEAVNAADAGEIAAAVRASMKQEAQCPRCHDALDVREGGIQGSVIVECKKCDAGAFSKAGGIQDAIRNLSRHLIARARPTAK